MHTKRIVFTGGGTGGHIYPLIAVLEELEAMKISKHEYFYVGPKSPFNGEFRERGIRIYTIASSKLRRYFDIENFLDIPKFFISLVQAFVYLYFIMPDVVFSKGGPGAFAVVLAARAYFIPIIVHESDSVPGLQNRLSSPFAKRIIVAFPTAVRYFQKAKVIFAGNPIRQKIYKEWTDSKTAKEKFGFNPNEPLLLILGSSQGSERINAFVFAYARMLLETTQILHQVGARNKKSAEEFIRNESQEIGAPLRNRYHFEDYFDVLTYNLALSAADVVLSRASAGAIYEIAAAGKPSILVPLRESANDHQRMNAYEYEKSGAAVVIEENNFSPNLVIGQIKSILDDKNRANSMSVAAKTFFKPDAAQIIAKEILFLLKSSSH